MTRWLKAYLPVNVIRATESSAFVSFGIFVTTSIGLCCHHSAWSFHSPGAPWLAGTPCALRISRVLGEFPLCLRWVQELLLGSLLLQHLPPPAKHKDKHKFNNLAQTVHDWVNYTWNLPLRPFLLSDQFSKIPLISRKIERHSSVREKMDN